MEIWHKLCNYPDRVYRMERLNKMVDGKVIPCAGMCPDCGQMQKD